MMRTAAKLAAIFVVVTFGVHLGYRRLEEELRKVSCVPPQPSDGAVSAAQNGSKTETTAAAAEDTPAPEAAAAADFQIIVSRNIFQVKQAAPPPPKSSEIKSQPQQQAAPTALNLVLAGTVTGTEKTARAIIIDNTGKKEQQLLRVGDGVQGAIIKAIEWNKVTLDVNGRMEILKMPEVGPNAPGQQAGGRAQPFQPPSFHAGQPPLPEEAMRGMPSARPNRRINLPPPDYGNPPEEEQHMNEPEIIEEMPAPPEEEPPPPELLPMDTE